MPTVSVQRVRAPRASQSGIAVVVDSSEMRTLSKQMRRTAPKLWRALLRDMRVAAAVVSEDARSRSSWSTRIPSSIRVQGTGYGLKVVAGGDTAPDAAPYENKGKQGDFRHPVFGNRDRWVTQTARPFLAPALYAHRDEVIRAITDGVTRAVDEGIRAR